MGGRGGAELDVSRSFFSCCYFVHRNCAKRKWQVVIKNLLSIFFFVPERDNWKSVGVNVENLKGRKNVFLFGILHREIVVVVVAAAAPAAADDDDVFFVCFCFK